MKTHLKLALLVLCMCATVNGQQTEDPSLTRLKQTIASFYEAIERGDAMARVEILDDNAILMPNGWHMQRGKENVARVFTADTAEALFRIKDRAVVELTMADSVAYTVNSYYYSYHKKGDPPLWRKTKNVHIWHKRGDGSWRLHVDIWNSDSPVEHMPPTEEQP